MSHEVTTNLIMPDEWRTEVYEIQSAYRGTSEPQWMSEYAPITCRALRFATHGEALRIMADLDDNGRRIMFRVVRIVTTYTIMEG